MDFSKLTAYLDSLQSEVGVEGLDVRVMRRHEEIYRHMTGYRDYEKTCPVSAEDFYDVYSATKVMTMISVLQLVEKGLLSLEDPVSRYLPEFEHMKVANEVDLLAFPFRAPKLSDPSREAENPILIHQLMSMTAGLSYDIESEPFQRLKAEKGEKATTRDVAAAIAQMPLLYEPGTRYMYSLGHDVLGAVVEEVSGERFEEYLKRHIFHPLEIDRMTMHPGEKEKARLAAQYSCDMETEVITPGPQGNRFRLSPLFDSGGAGLCCRVEDYSKVIDAIACGGVGKNGERILSRESIDIWRAPRLNEIQGQTFSRTKDGYNYGLGVRTLVDASKSKGPVGEFGWDGAAGAFALMDVENELSIFYAQQVLGMIKVYFVVHPTIRDLTYEAALNR